MCGNVVRLTVRDVMGLCDRNHLQYFSRCCYYYFPADIPVDIPVDTPVDFPQLTFQWQQYYFCFQAVHKSMARLFLVQFSKHTCRISTQIKIYNISYKNDKFRYACEVL